MPVITPYLSAYRSLLDNLERTSCAVESVYQVKKPEVKDGLYLRNLPPFCWAVEDTLHSCEVLSGVASTEYQTQFSYRVFVWATHSTKQTAHDTCLSYIDAVISCIQADPRLQYTVDTARPSLNSFDADISDNKYIYSAELEIKLCASVKKNTQIRKVLQNGS